MTAGHDGSPGDHRVGGWGAVDALGAQAERVQYGAERPGIENEGDQPQPAPQAGQASTSTSKDIELEVE